MPEIRPFRALRFDPEVVGDLGPLVAPPYDVIGEDLRAGAARAQPAQRGPPRPARSASRGEDPDERYRRVARTFAAWRSDGALRKDPRPAVYVYEQVYGCPAPTIERTQRGFFARLKPRAVRARGRGAARTSARSRPPREDRYRLLRATGVNTSPVVVLYARPGRRSAAADLAAVAATRRLVEVTDDDGVRHRLWVVTDDGAGRARVDG